MNCLLDLPRFSITLSKVIWRAFIATVIGVWVTIFGLGLFLLVAVSEDNASANKKPETFVTNCLSVVDEAILWPFLIPQDSQVPDVTVLLFAATALFWACAFGLGFTATKSAMRHFQILER